jgi:hypothetical protein
MVLTQVIKSIHFGEMNNGPALRFMGIFFVLLSDYRALLLRE